MSLLDSISIPRLTGSQEGRVLRRVELDKLSKGVREGDEVYVVGADWVRKWCSYSKVPMADIGTLAERTRWAREASEGDARSGDVEDDAAESDSSERPGCVDNGDILHPCEDGGDTDAQKITTDVSVKSNLVEGRDFFFLHKPAWNLLKDWYGIQSQSHEIVRYYRKDAQSGDVTVDVHGVEKVEDVTSPMSMSKDGEARDELEPSKRGGMVSQSEVSTPKPSLGINIPRFSSENVIQYGNAVSSPRVGLRSPGRGSMALSPLSTDSPLSRSFGPVPIWAEDSVYTGSRDRRGLSGLSNLGNTCFMNSSLQCLCHTPSLMYAFLSGKYKDDLNAENPLGLGGKLASAFGSLISKMWKPGVEYITPKHFKWQLAKFAPQFGGYSQQDSQELLAFLLDGLHEDLNRIKDKPYIEEKDADGRPDEEVAAEAWANYRARNDSVVVDKFQGLYKSTLRCPNCNYTSVKFDPFMYLSLPLPSPQRRTFVVTIVDQFQKANAVELAVRVSKESSIRDLIREIEKTYTEYSGTQVEEQEWAITQWTGSRLDVFLDQDASVGVIPEKRTFSFLSSRTYKLYVFRYTGDCVRPSIAGRPVLVYHRNNGVDCGIPSLFFLPKGTSEELTVKKAEKSGYWEVVPDKTLSHAIEKFQNISEQRIDAPEPVESSTEMDIEKTHTLLFGSSSGQPKYTWINSAPDIGSDADPSPIFLCAEWENFKPHSLTVVQEPVLEHESVKATENQANTPFKATLKDCLEGFCQPEQLDASDTWYCSKCKDHVRAIKKLDLWHLPDVLVVHLKRFSYSRYSRDKLDTEIEFPLHNLDMSEYLLNPSVASSKKIKLSSGSDTQPQEAEPIYDLYAVSNHYGGMGGGHYTAFCQMPDDQKWYDFDDSNVSEMNTRSVQSSAAYVLFYHRISSDVDLAKKALETADNITHEEDTRLCDSPIKSMTNRYLGRPSLDMVKEVPSSSTICEDDAATKSAKADEEDDDDIMNISAV